MNEVLMPCSQKTIDCRTDPYGYDSQDDDSDYWRYKNRVSLTLGSSAISDPNPNSWHSAGIVGL